MKLRFLGTGTSTGVPEIGCTCPVCTSPDPCDNRLRTSALVTADDGTRILIDCGPDFREQMMRCPDFSRIDGVLITHEHYDHVGGLDDLRPFCRLSSEIPVYANSYTAEHLQQRIPYCFATNPYPGIPRISLNSIASGESFKIGGVDILPFIVNHGRLPILGYRIGKLGYITDMLTMPEESYTALQGVDTLVINALRLKPHGSHQSISEALLAVERIRPRVAYLVHMSHHAGLHAELQTQLPHGVLPAYDGLEIEI